MVIACAIACDPKVIIADEPTTALDVTVQAEILELLRDLRDRLGRPIVLITHNMGVLADLADRVVVKNAGKVIETATVAKLFAAPSEDYTRTLLAAVPHLGQGNPEYQPTDEQTEVVLEVDNLGVQFPGGFKAVDAVTFTIERGKNLGLLGESGPGKSTIGRCVVALQKPTTGLVKILGQNIVGLSQRQLRRVRARLGFVFQDPATSLNPCLRVGDCVAEPLRVHKIMRGAKLAARVDELLDAVRPPTDTVSRYPHELSDGQRQRANGGLALSPDLLVAVEPASVLDVSVQASVLDLVEELQREGAIACLFISRDLAVVDRLADDVAVLRNGVLQEMGPRDQMLRNPQTEYTQRLVAAAPLPDPKEQRRRRDAAPAVRLTPRRSRQPTWPPSHPRSVLERRPPSGSRALIVLHGDDESRVAQGGQHLLPVCRTPGLDGKHHLNFVQRQLGCCAGVHHVEHAGPALADDTQQHAEPAGAVRDGDLDCEIPPGGAQAVGDHVGQHQRVDIATR